MIVTVLVVEVNRYWIFLLLLLVMVVLVVVLLVVVVDPKVSSNPTCSDSTICPTVNTRSRICGNKHQKLSQEATETHSNKVETSVTIEVGKLFQARVVWMFITFSAEPAQISTSK